MSASPSRLLILVLLVILVAAPLSSGDKGLWLAFTSGSSRLVTASVNQLNAEHSTLLPKHVGVSLATARGERADPTKGIATLVVSDGAQLAIRWVPTDRVGPAPRQLTASEASASRGPPLAGV
jgi:hypothetical protein